MADAHITEYSFKAGLPLEFELIDLAALYAQHHNKLTVPHRTSFYHLLWFRDKPATHIIDFKQHQLPANTLLFLNKGVVQQFSTVNPQGSALLFTDHFAALHPDTLTFLKSSILFNDLFETAQIRLTESDIAIRNLFDLMAHEAGHSQDRFQQAIQLNYLHNLLQLSERAYRRQGFREIKKSADLDYTLLFRDALETRHKSIRQVSQYARLLHVTEKRLHAATTKIMGRTPKEIIDERVMLEGKRLLVHTWLSVKEIGYDLGFEEPTNFIKYFRKHSGKTPVEFREQYSS